MRKHTIQLLCFRTDAMNARGVLAGRVIGFDAVLRQRLSYLLNTSDVINSIFFLQDEVCH